MLLPLLFSEAGKILAQVLQFLLISLHSIHLGTFAAALCEKKATRHFHFLICPGFSCYLFKPSILVIFLSSC